MPPRTANPTGTVEPAPDTDAAASGWRHRAQLAPGITVDFFIRADVVSEGAEHDELHNADEIEVRIDNEMHTLTRIPLEEGYELAPIHIRRDVAAGPGPDFVVEDMNFDGCRDLRVAKWHSGVGITYQYWLCDPAHKRLVAAPELNMLNQIDVFDATTGVVRDWRKRGPAEVERRTLKYVSGHLVVTDMEVTHSFGGFTYRRVLQRVGGELITVREEGRTHKITFCRIEGRDTGHTELGPLGHCVPPPQAP